MGKLKLPRLISNGVVLQQKKKIHIWGFDEPLRKVKVSFFGGGSYRTYQWGRHLGDLAWRTGGRRFLYHAHI